MDTPVQVYDPARILIPDLDYSDLETFFDDVNHHAPTINIRKDVKVLLRPLGATDASLPDDDTIGSFESSYLPSSALSWWL